MKNGTFRIARIVVALLVFAASLSACAPFTESKVSSAQSEQTLQRLQAARELDLSDALDPNIGPVASGDYSVRADKANQVMNELEHGQNVSQSQIADALFVPPTHLSARERAELIRQLEESRALDETGWREHEGGREPILEEDYNIQSRRATRVIRALESATPVSWTAINDAMQVPDGFSDGFY